MANSLRSKLHKKLLTFEKTGLISYKKYLNNQLKLFKNKPSAAGYLKDIQRQLNVTDRKLEKIAAKLKK